MGDIVLLAHSPMNPSERKEGKFIAKWDGPNVIEKTYPSGAYLLHDVEGDQNFPIINAKFLKRYYP